MQCTGEKKVYPALPLQPGSYDITTESCYHVFTRSVVCLPAQFEELWAVRDKVPATKNPMNPTTTIKRRQATYGSQYQFGRQTSVCIGTTEEAPSIIQSCVQFSRKCVAAKWPEVTGENYIAAHVNWYADGTEGIGFHQDDEACIREGDPIFSFTFLSEDGPSYRYFTVSKDRTIAGVVAEIPLTHGSCLVMDGKFQCELFHGIVPTSRKAFKHQRRINVTVRPWCA